MDTLAQGPAPSTAEQRRHQLGLQGVTYGQALAAKAYAQVDLKIFEVTFTGAQRFFETGSTEGAALASALGGEERNYGVEIARYRLNASGTHGRLSAGIYAFSPTGTRCWKLSLATGVLASAEVPYEFRLGATAFFSFDRLNDYSVVSADVWRQLSLGARTHLQLGGFFTWGQALRVPDTTVLHEFLVFTLGPCVALQTGMGRFSASVPVRVWVDRTAIGGYLSDFASPSILVGWQASL